MNRSNIVAITGGIGAGKSVVSRVLAVMGYPVYDCDTRARILMDTSDDIKAVIFREIAAEAIVDNAIDRKILSQVVFGDLSKLEKLNAIVHRRVRDDISQWVARQHSDTVFVETAILYQSGLDRMVDEVWEVVAPMELRIDRVMKRSALTRQEVKARIESQDSFEPGRLHPSVHRVINDGDMALLPQILLLLQ